LKLQGADGNWPVIEDKDIGLVQFCHGAPGFVLSLLAIRPYFPTLHTEIDEAIALGRKGTWEGGLLTKESNIGHGISGNALALEARLTGGNTFSAWRCRRELSKALQTGRLRRMRTHLGCCGERRVELGPGWKSGIEERVNSRFIVTSEPWSNMLNALLSC
jgi:hypothetical protein